MTNPTRITCLAVLLSLTACKGKESPAGAPAEAPAPTAAEPAAAAEAAAAADTTAAAEQDTCPELRKNGGIAACEAMCAKGSAKACTFAGYLHQEEDAEDVADTNAAPLFVKGCEGGDGLGCAELVVYHRGGLGGLAKDEAKAKQYMDKALVRLKAECEAGRASSCERAKKAEATP